MNEVRNMLVRMRQGDSDRALAKSGVAGRAKSATVRALAAERGGPSHDTALTREGIAQVRQGKYAEAVSTFEGVTSGERATIAALWKAYAASKAANTAAPAPAAPAAAAAE